MPRRFSLRRACAQLSLATLLFIPSFAPAQAPASATTITTPAAAQAPVISPEILADGRVTFRIRAPKATNVTVSGQFTKGAIALVKDEMGVWSATLGPIAPDIYEYSFSVDGVAMIDPTNRAVKPMRSPRTSILALPA